MRTASQEMSWGSLVLATVVLGGMGLVFVGGAFEIAQNTGFGLGFLGAMAIGLGVWGVLTVLYWLNWRSAKFRAAQFNEPWRRSKDGGFLMGYLVGVVGLFSIHAVSFFSIGSTNLPEDVRFVALLIAFNPLMGLAYMLLPLLTGWFWRVIRATSIA